MARSLPTVVVQAALAQQTGYAFLVGAEISHSSFSTVRIVNNTEAVTVGAQPYSPFPFSIILPPDSEDLRVRARMVIYDAEREIIDNLRVVAGNSERIAVTLYVVSVAPDDTLEVLQTVSGLQVINVTYTAGALNLDMNVEQFLNEGWPRDSFTPGNFPGVF